MTGEDLDQMEAMIPELRAREAMDLASAMTVATGGADPDEAKSWWREQKSTAGMRERATRPTTRADLEAGIAMFGFVNRSGT